jgi:hypothetical protein
MFLFCYAQWPNYLQHVVFPSPSILQRYIEFHVHTIAMSKKLLKYGSFGTIVGHWLVIGHSSCFFRGARPSLSGLTCCSRLLKMLSFDCSCTSLLFPIGWSPYSFLCDDTCRNQYLSLLGHTTRYLYDVS